jgi:hypothetical protein
MYAANSYYTPNAQRQNLVLLTGAQATKIVFGKNQLATGVEYTVNGTTYTAHSSKEVILAAGSKSPSFLPLLFLPNDRIIEDPTTAGAVRSGRQDASTETENSCSRRFAGCG